MCVVLVALPSRYAPIFAQVKNGEVDSSDRLQWRRTNLGWEPSSRWGTEIGESTALPATTGVHPLVVAALQVLASFAALLTFADRKRTKELG